MALLHGLGQPRQPDLFTSFWLAAHWVWERRETAKQSGLPFSEETITETLLLDLATQNPLEILVQPFNKRQEGKIGADWEWCFYSKGRNRFVRTLVQAKVLDDSDDEYAHIDRKIGNTTVAQIDQLLTTARRRGIPALYAFYNHLKDSKRVPADACPCGFCLKCWGCSIALADVVRAALPDKSFDTLRHVSVPWLCLLCPAEAPLSANDGAPDRVAEALGRLEKTSRMSFPDFSSKDHVPLVDLVNSEAPEYFLQLEQLARIDSPVERQMRVEKLAAQNPGVDGIVLVTDQTESDLTPVPNPQ